MFVFHFFPSTTNFFVNIFFSLDSWPVAQLSLISTSILLCEAFLDSWSTPSTAVFRLSCGWACISSGLSYAAVLLLCARPLSVRECVSGQLKNKQTNTHKNSLFGWQDDCVILTVFGVSKQAEKLRDFLEYKDMWALSLSLSLSLSLLFFSLFCCIPLAFCVHIWSVCKTVLAWACS